MNKTRKKASNTLEFTILQLYACHFSAKEVASITGMSYSAIVSRFQALKNSSYPQYDRYTLLPEPTYSQIKESLNADANTN